MTDPLPPYPTRDDSESTWSEWLESVAPYRGRCHPDLHPELRFYATVKDRQIANASVVGLVGLLRKRREI